MLLSLGWLGVVLYFIGLIAWVLRRNRAKGDDLARTCEAICIAFLLQLVGGPVFNGITGFMFWMAMGLTVSADRWHAAQNEEIEAQPSLALPPAARVPVLAR